MPGANGSSERHAEKQRRFVSVDAAAIATSRVPRVVKERDVSVMEAQARFNGRADAEAGSKAVVRLSVDDIGHVESAAVRVKGNRSERIAGSHKRLPRGSLRAEV